MKVAKKKGRYDVGPTSLQGKFDRARSALSASLIEREEEIDLCLTALLCREHVLLVGPPGTGKTMLANCLADLLDARQFYYLLTKFTDPGELFGPVDIAALKRGETRRVTEGYAGDCEVLCLDEIFKASSAILNTTLTLLNERKLTIGKQVVDCPLVMGIGLSNEWPNSQDGGQELSALFDRFLFRKTVRYIKTKAGKERLRWEKDLTPGFEENISGGEVEQAAEEAASIFFSEGAKDCYERIFAELNKEGIRPGDRRDRKAIKACRAFAYLQGHDRVMAEDLTILSHLLWDDPQEQEGEVSKIVNRIANPVGSLLTEKLTEAESIVATSSPTDAVEKLKTIESSLLSVSDARAEQALKIVRQHIADSYARAIGRKVDA